MTEEQHRRWDIRIKIGGFLGLMISAFIGANQYQDMRTREISQFADAKEREFYAEFWDQRLRLYLKTLDAAARISSAPTLEDSARARQEFRTLFDGSMAVVQDPLVDTAIHEFAAKVEMVEAGQMDHKDLGIYSYRFGRTCYKSLKDSWDKPFSAAKSQPAGTSSAN